MQGAYQATTGRDSPPVQRMTIASQLDQISASVFSASESLVGALRELRHDTPTLSNGACPPKEARPLTLIEKLSDLNDRARAVSAMAEELRTFIS